MRFTLDTYFCFDGEHGEDIRVRFRYIPAFAGTQLDPPHGDDVEIEDARRLHVPFEELDDGEWNAVSDNASIKDECLYVARRKIKEAYESRGDRYDR